MEGYEKALDKALEILPSLVCHEIKDIRNEQDIKKAIKTVVMSKQYGNEDFLTDIITKACGKVLSILIKHLRCIEMFPDLVFD